MQNEVFRTKDHRLILIGIVICILLPIFLFFDNTFELKTILSLCFYLSLGLINMINRLYARLSINNDGILIYQIFQKDIFISWNDIEGIQEFTNYHRNFHYITLNQTLKLPNLPYSQNLPKYYRNRAIILDAWENHTRIIKHIQTKVSFKPKNQLFVPIAGKSWNKIFPYAIFIFGLGAALLAWSLQ
ncbi:hypothetical protein [Herpetosiphon geysericola]|uniref:PH domain-containing protein n=1 Tax=Herpetosiphon geysericola TaxID=70996 RepID=A0A0P6XLI3_9CHLR|nr:hypothetical protein [Herpetosiphon geysericola]KPL81159.1 hypothetical protein SE18_20890 [Herpetosiphon geysericola]